MRDEFDDPRFHGLSFDGNVVLEGRIKKVEERVGTSKVGVAEEEGLPTEEKEKNKTEATVDTVEGKAAEKRKGLVYNHGNTESTGEKDASPLHLIDSSDDDSDGDDDGDVYKISYRDTPGRPICQASPSTPAKDPSPETLDKNDSKVNDLIDRVVPDSLKKDERAEKEKKECQIEKTKEKEHEEEEEEKEEEGEEGKKDHGKGEREDKDGEGDGGGEGDGKSVREGQGESEDGENEGGGNTEGGVGEKKVEGGSSRGMERKFLFPFPPLTCSRSQMRRCTKSFRLGSTLG